MLIVLLGLIVVFVLLLLFSRPGTRACRWRADKTRDNDQGSYHRCAACGAEIWAHSGLPKTCLRDKR